MSFLSTRVRAGLLSRTLLLGAVSLSAFAAGTAQAQEIGATKPAPAQSETTTIETARGDDIIVRGTRPIRESQDAALRTQQQSTSLVSVLSADSVGRLPDQNIAQAVSRLPGLATQRDQGQARYVSVRGAPNNWTTIAFDGINIVSPEGRDARFDSIPSALAAQIIVKKAVTPDLTAETLAGQIDVITRSAFDYKDYYVALRGGGGYVDLGKGAEFEGTAVLAKRFNTGIGEIGLLAAGTFYRRGMATDNFETDWEEVVQDQRPELGNFGRPRFWARETENKLYRLTRYNYSSTVRIDWRPSENHRLFAYSIYSAFRDDELRWNGIYDFDDQQGRVPTANTACPTAFALPAVNTTGYADICTGNTPYQGFVYGIDVNYNALSREYLQSVQINTFGGDHKFGDWEVLWRGNYTRSADDRSAPAQLNYESPGFGTNGATATGRPTVFYDLTNPELARVALYRTLRAANGQLSAGDRYFQFEDLPMALNRIRSLQAVDITDAYTGRLVVARNTGLFGDTRFEAGFQYDNRTKEAFETLLDINPNSVAPGTTTNVFAASGVPTNIGAITIDQPYKGALPLGFNFRYFSKAQIYAIVDRVRPFGIQAFVRDNFYNVNEEVISGYVKATSRFDWGNIVYGVRVERVRNTAQAYSSAPNAATGRVLQTISRDFLEAYPSIHVNWDVTREHKIRLSFNTGAARPDYPVLRPNFVYNDANLTISGGNPDARPERARGVDLYWEYYPRAGGFISVGAFYKSVSDVLFGSTRTFGLNILNFNNVDRSQYVLSTVVNGGGGEIYGAEATIQYQLDDLLKTSSWLGGFGIQANGVINRSSARTPDGRTVRLPGTSDYVLNVGPYYERYGLSIRAQYQFRTDWIDSLGDNTTGGDIYWAAEDELDVSARYAVTKHFELYFDASNLLNDPGRRFAGISARTIERETFGRRFVAGFRLTY